MKIMPKIFEYFGFIFYFYSNEHEPIHVHVLHGGKESIFDLIMMNGELAEIRARERNMEPSRCRRRISARQSCSSASTTRTSSTSG